MGKPLDKYNFYGYVDLSLVHKPSIKETQMLDSTEFACVDELDDSFFLTFGDETDINAINAESHDPDLWDDDDVPY